MLITRSNSSSSNSTSASSSKKVTTPTYKTTITKFNINGSYVEIDVIIDNEMTLVEMRPLCDALGIQIEWDSQTSTATCTKGNTRFSLTVGSKSAKLNGNLIALDRSPKLVENRILLPARFVSESIGKTVNYDSSSRKINID